MDHSCFIHSPPKRHFSCFQVLAIMHKAAINIHAHVVWADLILNVNLHDCVLMFPLAFSVPCGCGTKTQKWIHDLYTIQNTGFCNHCIFDNMTINFKIISLTHYRFIQSCI